MCSACDSCRHCLPLIRSGGCAIRHSIRGRGLPRWLNQRLRKDAVGCPAAWVPQPLGGGWSPTAKGLTSLTDKAMTSLQMVLHGCRRTLAQYGAFLDRCVLGFRTLLQAGGKTRLDTVCEYCGETTPSNEAYCSACGCPQPLAMGSMRVCGLCGLITTRAEPLCVECGK